MRRAWITALYAVGLLLTTPGCNVVPQAKLPVLRLNEFLPARIGDEQLRTKDGLRTVVDWLNAHKDGWTIERTFSFTPNFFIRFMDATTGCEVIVAQGYRHGSEDDSPVGVMLSDAEGTTCYNRNLPRDDANRLFNLIGSLR